MTPQEQEEYMRQVMLKRMVQQQQQQIRQEPAFVEDSQLRQEIYDTYRRGPQLMEAHIIKMGAPLPILHYRNPNVRPFNKRPIRAPLAGHICTANIVRPRRSNVIEVDDFESIPF